MENNLTWHNTEISKEKRADIKKQKPCVIWLTGLSSSGKSTIANALESELYNMGLHTYLLDGDNVRMGLNSDLGFDNDSRVENIRRIAEVCRLFVDSGIIVISAIISPFEKDRNMARGIVKSDGFIEIFVDTPLLVCEKRDAKGLYKKARQGLISNFTGITSPYEAPKKPEIHLKNTDDTSIKSHVNTIIRYLKHNRYIML